MNNFWSKRKFPPNGVTSQSNPKIPPKDVTPPPAPVISQPKKKKKKSKKKMREYVCTYSTLYPPKLGQYLPLAIKKPPLCTTIWVGGLPKNTTEPIIRDVFGIFGEICELKQKSQYFCHISYKNEESLDKALALSGYRLAIGNRQNPDDCGVIYVDYAKSRQDVLKSKADLCLNGSEHETSRSSCTESNAEKTKNRSNLTQTSQIADQDLTYKVDLDDIDNHVKLLKKLKNDAEREIQDMKLKLEDLEKTVRNFERRKNEDSNLSSTIKQLKFEIINLKVKKLAKSSEKTGLEDLLITFWKLINRYPILEQVAEKTMDELKVLRLSNENLLKAKSALEETLWDCRSAGQEVESLQKQLHILKLKCETDDKLQHLQYELAQAKREASRTADMFTIQDTRLVGLISTFLLPYRLGAKLEDIRGYISKFNIDITATELESLLVRCYTVFQRNSEQWWVLNVYNETEIRQNYETEASKAPATSQIVDSIPEVEDTTASTSKETSKDTHKNVQASGQIKPNHQAKAKQYFDGSNMPNQTTIQITSNIKEVEGCINVNSYVGEENLVPVKENLQVKQKSAETEFNFVEVEKNSVQVKGYSVRLEDSMEVAENHVPVKEKSLQLEEKSMKVGEYGVPVEENSVNIPENSVEIDENSLDIEDNLVPVKGNSLQLKEKSVKDGEHGVQVEENFVEIEGHSMDIEEKLEVKENCMQSKENSEQVENSVKMAGNFAFVEENYVQGKQNLVEIVGNWNGMSGNLGKLRETSLQFSVPVKENSLQLTEKSVKVRENSVQVEEKSSVEIKENDVQPKRNSVQVESSMEVADNSMGIEENLVPGEENYLQLNENFVKVVINCVQLEENSVKIQENSEEVKENCMQSKENSEQVENSVKMAGNSVCVEENYLQGKQNLLEIVGNSLKVTENCAQISDREIETDVTSIIIVDDSDCEIDSNETTRKTYNSSSPKLLTVQKGVSVNLDKLPETSLQFSVPVKENFLQVTEKSVKVGENGVQVEEKSVEIKENYLQAKRNSVQVENSREVADNSMGIEENLVPGEENYLQRNEKSVKVGENGVQVEGKSVEIKENYVQAKVNSMQVENSMIVADNSMDIEQNLVPVEENYWQLNENLVQVVENCVQVEENSVKIQENSVEVKENCIQSKENSEQVENSVKMARKSVCVEENYVQGKQNLEEIVGNSLKVTENCAQIADREIETDVTSIIIVDDSDCEIDSNETTRKTVNSCSPKLHTIQKGMSGNLDKLREIILQFSVPVKENSLQLTEKSVKVGENGVQVEEKSVEIKENYVQATRKSVQVENSMDVADNSMGIEENLVPGEEKYLQLNENFVKVGKNCVQLEENSVKIQENSVELKENFVQSEEYSEQVENSVKMAGNSVDVEENYLQGKQNLVEIVGNSLKVIENCAQIADREIETDVTSIIIVDDSDCEIDSNETTRKTYISRSPKLHTVQKGMSGNLDKLRETVLQFSVKNIQFTDSIFLQGRIRDLYKSLRNLYENISKLRDGMDNFTTIGTIMGHQYTQVIFYFSQEYFSVIENLVKNFLMNGPKPTRVCIRSVPRHLAAMEGLRRCSLGCLRAAIGHFLKINSEHVWGTNTFMECKEAFDLIETYLSNTSYSLDVLAATFKKLQFSEDSCQSDQLSKSKISKNKKIKETIFPTNAADKSNLEGSETVVDNFNNVTLKEVNSSVLFDSHAENKITNLEKHSKLKSDKRNKWENEVYFDSRKQYRNKSIGKGINTDNTKIRESNKRKNVSLKEVEDDTIITLESKHICDKYLASHLSISDSNLPEAPFKKLKLDLSNSASASMKSRTHRWKNPTIINENLGITRKNYEKSDAFPTSQTHNNQLEDDISTDQQVRVKTNRSNMAPEIRQTKDADRSIDANQVQQNVKNEGTFTSTYLTDIFNVKMDKFAKTTQDLRNELEQLFNDSEEPEIMFVGADDLKLF